MRRFLFILAVGVLSLALTLSAEAKPAKKKVRQPSKEMQEYLKQMPLLKEAVKEPQSFLSRAKSAEMDAKRLGEELAALLAPPKTKRTEHPRIDASPAEMEAKARELVATLKTARDSLAAARKKYAAFKEKYGPARQYYIQKMRESPLVARTKKDMKWLADKCTTLKKGMDDSARRLTKLAETEKQLQKAFQAKGLNYPEPEADPEPAAGPEPGSPRP